MEWRDVGDHTVFTFNDTSNWDVNDVDFTVGGADPQEFYRSDACIAPNYRGRRSRSPETVTLVLSDGDKVTLKIC